MINKSIYLLFITCLLFAQDDQEEWLKKQEEELNALLEEQNSYMVAVSKEFDDFVAEQERLFEDFKKDVEKKWDEFKSSTNKTYVDYDSDLNARGSIDFENGVVEVEVIVDDDPNLTDQEKKQAGDEKLKDKLADMVTKKADDKETLLKDQLADDKGKTVTPLTAKSFAKDVVKEKEVKKHEFKSKDGKKKIKYAVKVFMQPDHVKTRAGRFKKEVLTQSKRFKIDPAIAFAIMHTESSFNPKARSPIPAFGLMQLVPKSGARDAYNYIYKQDRLLSDTYLYVPANNIELGCAYIAKIRHDYFKNIKDEKSAYFCTISAYNTGIGNVAMALTGKTKLGPTAEKVNTMKSDKLFNTLKMKLPYAETRNYLKKVTERIDYYRTWI